jgi:hypothetical protein
VSAAEPSQVESQTGYWRRADAKEPLEVRWQNDSYVNLPLWR